MPVMVTGPLLRVAEVGENLRLEIEGGLGAEPPPPPPLQAATSRIITKEENILFDFINIYFGRYQVWGVRPALQVPQVTPFFDNDAIRLHPESSLTAFSGSLPQGILVLTRIGT